MTWLTGAILSLAASLVYGAALYMRGRAGAKRETALEAAERYAKTRKDMDDASDIPGSDPDAARRWLHERGKSDGDM